MTNKQTKYTIKINGINCSGNIGTPTYNRPAPVREREEEGTKYMDRSVFWYKRLMQ